MQNKQAYVRKPTIQVTFITDNNQFSLTFDTSEEKSDNGLVLNKGDISAGIISFLTTNDMYDDSGTFTLNLAGSERFDRILSPNDIIIIKINPGKPNNVKNDVIMVGMVGSAKRIGEYDSSSIVYQITGNSLLKALMQMKLGTIQEVASLLGTNGWMMGMGTLKGASTYLETSDSGSGTKATLDDLKKEASSSEKKVVVSAFRGAKYYKGISDKDLVVATDTSYAIGSYVYISGYGVAKVGYHLGTDLKTTQLVNDSRLLGKAPAIFVNLPASQVKAFGTQFKTVYKYKSKPKTTTDSASGTDSNNLITDGSQGLVLQGQSSASIVSQLINWFLRMHTTYIYENGKHNIKDYITQDLTSQSDEFLTDPTPIMSFSGSLRQLISDNQAKPFNEFFADYTPEGLMKMVMRPTPFEPDDWNSLYDNGTALYSNDVVEETIGKNNDEVYSIFLANMPSSILVSQLSTLLTFPLYFPDLANRYGYSMLQVENPYIFAFVSGQTEGGSDDAGNVLNTSGNSNAEKVWNMLKSEGFNDYATAGILGNMYAESSVEPATTEAGGGGGYGLVQWTPKSKLTTYANSVGKSADALATQVEFLVKQLKGTTTIYPDTAAYGPLMSATSVNQATEAFLNLYERAGVANLSKREQAAQGYYSQYHTSKGNETTKSDTTTNSSSSSSDTSKMSGSGNANRLKRYSTLLANWYGDNASYLSGELRVLGNPDYRIGNVLIRYDNGESDKGNTNAVQVDYYIESVSHEYNLTSGYTTTLGVTRGLPHSVDRFKHWNDWNSALSKENPGNGRLQFFNGGLFGELALSDNITLEADSNSDGSGKNGGGSNNVNNVGRGDDYPSKWRNASPDSLTDDWNYYNRECVSFCAWRLKQEGKTGFSSLGNAVTWYANSGLKKQSTPKIGDIAWFDASAAGVGAAGHVAYVAEVSGDSVFLEEYNFNYSHGYHTRSIKSSQVTGFLRFKNA